ncbi:hypothetical protein AB0C84_44720 [Actinomadura sp. NPDC048955]|uniref:hypothetical protein n=1 Tax=Actinomadura sp. NPDC048955 TaxID=3158228 RepID=UPI00340A30E2
MSALSDAAGARAAEKKAFNRHGNRSPIYQEVHRRAQEAILKARAAGHSYAEIEAAANTEA